LAIAALNAGVAARVALSPATCSCHVVNETITADRNGSGNAANSGSRFLRKDMDRRHQRKSIMITKTGDQGVALFVFAAGVSACPARLSGDNKRRNRLALSR
jgi:hypothetical protein